MRKMFAPPSKMAAAALYHRVEEESSEFSSRLTTHVANNNMSLNRWHNILAYDTTRVVLLPRPDVGANNDNNYGISTDYINANHIRVPEASKHYILTQGPIDKDDHRQRTLSSSMMLMLGQPVGGGNTRSYTVPHFWSMVWQQQSPAIVMLCRTHERDAYGCLQCKCAKYWPTSVSDEDTMQMEDLEIRLLQEQALKTTKTTTSVETSPSLTGANKESTPADILTNQCTVVRKLEIRQPTTNEKRYVTQYHYQKWPDFGVPDGKEVDNFLKLVSHVAEEHPSREERPNIIHCSAGVGRSGTFCLVDSCLERMLKTGEPITQEQVIDTLLHMRRQRMGLIQTDDQLRFALLAISAGSDDVLQRARAVQKANDLIHSSKNVISVPSNSNRSKRNSVSPASIRDNLNLSNENGVMTDPQEAGDITTSPSISGVEGIKSITSNGKTKTKEGILASGLARKRSTDIGNEDGEYNHTSSKSLIEGSAVATKLDEGTEEDIITSISADHATGAGSMAKRKKSERDC